MDINPMVVDISHYDDVEVDGGNYVGFAKLRAAGYVGVINKATEGRGSVDKTYNLRKQPALDAGLLYGAYHFFTTEDPVQQAAHFLDTVNPDANTLLALDHETPSVPLANAKVFLQEVFRRTRRFPLLYSFSSMLKTQFQDVTDPFWNDISLWLAHYTTEPSWPPIWDAPTLWQFTGDGNGPSPHQVPGVTIDGGCDINSYDGTRDQLAAQWTGAPIPAVTQPAMVA